ncbi:putative translocase of outer mitochondrial membrane 7 [Crotalus adamanteus]|uniref:Mitochondrial import receptor subunit TOM7 homolog n=1 Tax=Crotalus adamanteus TaxID=8729 RepID=A0AAW1B362_CROAD
MPKLSKEAKQRLQHLFKGGQFAIRWGFIPVVLYLDQRLLRKMAHGDTSFHMQLCPQSFKKLLIGGMEYNYDRQLMGKLN